MADLQRDERYEEDIVTQAIGDRVQYEYTLYETGDVYEDQVEIFGCRALVRNVYSRLTGKMVFDGDHAVDLMRELTGRTCSRFA